MSLTKRLVALLIISCILFSGMAFAEDTIFPNVPVTELGRYDTNSFKNEIFATLADQTTEHWYRVYLHAGTLFRNCITLCCDNSPVDFTIRTIDQPKNVIYASSEDRDARRRNYIKYFGSVTKVDDYRPLQSNYYYLVVKAENAVSNERYKLTVGDPIALMDHTIIYGGSNIRISVANTYVNTNINVRETDNIPPSAVVTSISAFGNSSNGYAEIGIRKNTESTFHSGTYAWTYTYTNQWRENLIPVIGVWNFRAKIKSSSRLPISFLPRYNLTYLYELGDLATR